MERGFLDIAKALPPGLKTAALILSLALSAALTAVALQAPDLRWLGWISFLPLFGVVRALRPSKAALAGGFWGACLYACCIVSPAPGTSSAALTVATPPPLFLDPPAFAFDALALTTEPTAHAIGLPAYAHAQAGASAWLLALLILIPAVYLGLAARHTRSIASRLLLLALGWPLIETVLHLHNLFGPRDGLLTGSQGEALHLHWLAHLLAYVCTAFLVGCANTSLVGILSRARLSFPPCQSLTESPNIVGWLPSQVVLAIPCWTVRQAQPRAPPPLAAV